MSDNEKKPRLVDQTTDVFSAGGDSDTSLFERVAEIHKNHQSDGNKPAFLIAYSTDVVQGHYGLAILDSVSKVNGFIAETANVESVSGHQAETIGAEIIRDSLLEPNEGVVHRPSLLAIIDLNSPLSEQCREQDFSVVGFLAREPIIPDALKGSVQIVTAEPADNSDHPFFN